MLSGYAHVLILLSVVIAPYPPDITSYSIVA